MVRRVEKIKLTLKMCACGRLKADKNWRMIRTPVFDFVQRIVGSNVHAVTFTNETCPRCR